MKIIAILLTVLCVSCARFDYQIVSVEPVGDDYYVVYKINDLKREAMLDEYGLDKLMEVASVGVY